MELVGGHEISLCKLPSLQASIVKLAKWNDRDDLCKFIVSNGALVCTLDYSREIPLSEREKNVFFGFVFLITVLGNLLNVVLGQIFTGITHPR